MNFEYNITAPATRPGSGAVGIIRVSGEDSITILSTLFRSYTKGKLKSVNLSKAEPYKMLFGAVADEKGNIIDQVLAAVFIAPHSYTGENSVEIYCHSSAYIMNKIQMLLINSAAILFRKKKIKYPLQVAQAGEFTKRAFLNGKMDLAQAEAVADLIASENKAAHAVAMNQMKGGFSKELKILREQLLNLLSLVELELDFGEEDVEFASRREMESLLEDTESRINRLISSFSLGNVIRNGIPTTIVGAVNTGKSTLLNLLVGEERAIVSDIEGTTRDSIEDSVNIKGHLFRFTDTAGIRKTSETVEIMGIERTYEKLRKASIVILLLDASRKANFEPSIKNVSQKINKNSQNLIVIVNKIDTLLNNRVCGKKKTKTDGCTEKLAEIEEKVATLCSKYRIKASDIICTSLKHDQSPIDELITTLTKIAGKLTKGTENEVLVTNARHYEALLKAQHSLKTAHQSLNNQAPADLMAQDLKDVIEDLAQITGEITSQDILSNIFKNFCIGK